jgi:hypothetical protein
MGAFPGEKKIGHTDKEKKETHEEKRLGSHLYDEIDIGCNGCQLKKGKEGSFEAWSVISDPGITYDNERKVVKNKEKQHKS